MEVGRLQEILGVGQSGYLELLLRTASQAKRGDLTQAMETAPLQLAF